MRQCIAHIALIVDDYDEALEFYTKKLDFKVIEDTRLNDDKRWVIIGPRGSKESSILLTKASTERQKFRVGKQAGGRVFLFLQTDDFWRDYNNMRDRKVNFVLPPKEENHATVAVFEDLYGNLWDLLEPKNELEIEIQYNEYLFGNP